MSDRLSNQRKVNKNLAFFIDKEELHIIRIKVRYGTDARTVAFYDTGEIFKIVDEFRTAKLNVFYCFEKNGDLRWMVNESKGKIAEFWALDGKALVQRFDYAVAQRLIGQ